MNSNAQGIFPKGGICYRHIRIRALSLVEYLTSFLVFFFFWAEFKAKVTTASVDALKPSKKAQKQPTVKPKEKPRDLETALKNVQNSVCAFLCTFVRLRKFKIVWPELCWFQVSPEQLRIYYQELTKSDSVGDAYLSWIKYSADALNSQLNTIPAPDSLQWPHNLSFPVIPKGLEVVIQSIITKTAASQENVDVIGLAFSSLLGSIPTLVLRGKWITNEELIMTANHVN